MGERHAQLELQRSARPRFRLLPVGDEKAGGHAGDAEADADLFGSAGGREGGGGGEGGGGSVSPAPRHWAVSRYCDCGACAMACRVTFGCSPFRVQATWSNKK